MSKTEKLVIGQPYSIIARDGNRIIKVSGDCLTKEDVEYYIESGILTKDDIFVDEKKPNLYPDFVDIATSIDEKFFPWKFFIYNLFMKYPTAAKAVLLKEYSKIACSKIKVKDEVYLISLIDGSISKFKATKDMLSTYSCFPSMDSAKEAFSEMSKGVLNFI